MILLYETKGDAYLRLGSEEDSDRYYRLALSLGADKRALDTQICRHRFLMNEPDAASDDDNIYFQS